VGTAASAVEQNLAAGERRESRAQKGPGQARKRSRWRCFAADADMADTFTFTIRATDHANVRGRAVRRVFLSDHALKLAKLFAGDVVVLTAASDTYQEQVGVPLHRMRCRNFIAFPSRDTSP